MQRSTNAGTALRAIQCLPALTGQWQWPAGGISGAVSIGQVNLPSLARPDLKPTGVREVNMIQLGRVLTDPAMRPPIRALYVWNSNPAVIAANQQPVLEGLRRDDLFTVVHDQFLIDTAGFALGMAGFTWITSAVAFTLAEDVGADGSFHSFFDALWWSSATITTVGYGDVFPITTAGRLVGMVTMVVGISTFAVVTAKIAEFLVRADLESASNQ